MVKIKAHPRVANPKQQQLVQHQRRRTARSTIRYYSSSSESESESTPGGETRTISNQMDSLALIGGSSNEKPKPKESTARGGQLAAAAQNRSKQKQNLNDTSPVQSFSVLMGLDVNEEKWAKSKQQSQQLATNRTRRNNKVAPTRTSRPKKPVGDSLAGSLMASLSLSENEDGHIFRGIQTKPTKQLQRSKRPHPGFSSSLLVAAARDGAAAEKTTTKQQQQPPRGNALRRAYAAAGKQMRPSNRCRLGNKHPRGGAARRSTRSTIAKPSSTSALEAVVGALQEDPSEKPNQLPSTSTLGHQQAAKPKTNKLKNDGTEKRVAFAGEVKAGPSMLEALVANKDDHGVESNRLLQIPQAKPNNVKVKQQDDKHKRVTFARQMKVSQSTGFAKGNEGGLLSLFGGEVHTTDESAQKTTPAPTTKRMSIPSLGTTGSPEIVTSLRMDCVTSPSPLKKSDQKSLVGCLERCHIEECHTADNSSRKRMEVASPELKVNRKRRDQKKTPGKKEAEPSTAVVDDLQPSPLSASDHFSEKLSQSPMRELKKSPERRNTKSRGSKHMIVDLENSVSDLSDDEVFGNSAQPALDSSPALSVCAESPAEEACQPVAPLHALQSTHIDSAVEHAGAAAATLRLSNGIHMDDRSVTKSRSTQNEESLGDNVCAPPVGGRICSSSQQSPSPSSSISIQSIQNLSTVNDASSNQPSDNQIHSSPSRFPVASREIPMKDSDSPEKAQGGREKCAPESLDVDHQSQIARLSSPQPPPPSRMQIESPPKETKAKEEKSETAAFAARRSRRQRTVTDRFTIAAHTAGGLYVAPQPPMEVAQKKAGRRTKPQSKNPPHPKQERKKQNMTAVERVDGCSDEGHSSEILFESLDSSRSESILNENDGIQGNLMIDQRPEKTTERSQNGAANNSQGKKSTQKLWRSRRERKQTDFFHQLDNGNTTENGTPPEKMNLPLDADMLSLSSSSVDNSNCGPRQSDDDNDNDISIQRPRRERKKTAFYHNDYLKGNARNMAESMSEVSEDDQSGDMTCSPNGKEASIRGEETAVLPVRQGPRRIRRFTGRKPLLAKGKLKPYASSSDDDWSPEELECLSSAMAKVDPTSDTFWYTVAMLVNDRSESECRSKWFSIAKTPMPKLTKKEAMQQIDTDHGDDEDDIFNSSPMRGFLLPDNGIQDSKHRATAFVDENIGSAIKVEGKTSDVALCSMSTNMSSFRPKVGYKTYLQNLRRDVSRAEKADAGRKVAAKIKEPRAISDAVYDADVDVNARLTPGGTLKVKSQYEDEEDDFWAADYDAGDEEEMYE